MKAREYLDENHPMAILLMDGIGKEIGTDFTSGIVDVMEEYHRHRLSEITEEKLNK